MKKLVFLSICCLFLGCSRSVEVWQLDANDVLQIEIFPSRWEGRDQPPEILTLKEIDSIRAVLTVLEPVGECDRSRMNDQVKIIVMEKSGRKNLVQLQPGGDPGYYEYLAQGNGYRIRRGPFLEVMKSLGIGWIPR